MSLDPTEAVNRCSVGSCRRHGCCMYLNHPRCPLATHTVAPDEDAKWLRSLDGQFTLETRQRLERIASLFERREGLVEALEGAERAIQAAYAQADAEARDHMKAAAKHAQVVVDWRVKRDAALGKQQP